MVIPLPTDEKILAINKASKRRSRRRIVDKETHRFSRILKFKEEFVTDRVEMNSSL